MKRIITVIVLVLVVCGGIYFIYGDREDIQNNLEKEIEDFSEEKTKDIFNEYYNDAKKLMGKMTLGEKVGQ